MENTTISNYITSLIIQLIISQKILVFLKYSYLINDIDALIESTLFNIGRFLLKNL